MNPECEKYRIEINSFLDGEGIEETGHESSCSACRLYKNEIVEMRKLFRENRDVPIPDALEKRILESAEKTFPHAFFGPKTFQAAWFSGWAGNLCFLTVALIILGTFFFRDAKSSNLLWTRMKMAPSQMIDSVFRLSSKVNASFTFRSGSVLTIWGGPAKITFDQENFDRGGKQTLGCSVDEGHACFSFAGQRSELFFVTFELGKVVSSGA
ncbi:hypothetical protein HYY75_05835, partial [bacterium]|nr:hypothetical protein [bacterium]